MLDKNTIISQDELEKGIPHFYADLNDLKELLANFQVELIKHTEYYYDFNNKIIVEENSITSMRA